MRETVSREVAFEVKVIDKDRKMVVDTYYPLANRLMDDGIKVNFVLRADGLNNVELKNHIACIDERISISELPPWQYHELSGVNLFVLDNYSWKDNCYRLPQGTKTLSSAHALALLKEGDAERVLTRGPWVYGLNQYDFYVMGCRRGFELFREHKRLFGDFFPPDLCRSNEKNFFLIPDGYLRLDKYVALTRRSSDETTPTITVMPASLATTRINLGQKVERQTEEMIKGLVERHPSLNIIYRPYPSDLESDMVVRVADRYRGVENFSIHTGEKLGELYTKTSVFITDNSSAGLSYSLCTGRPGIFFFNGGASDFHKDLGIQVRTEEELVAQVENLLGTSGERTSRPHGLGNKFVFNLGQAAAAHQKSIHLILEGETSDDWIEVTRNQGRHFTDPKHYLDMAKKMESYSDNPIYIANVLEVGLRKFPDDSTLLNCFEDLLINVNEEHITGSFRLDLYLVRAAFYALRNRWSNWQEEIGSFISRYGIDELIRQDRFVSPLSKALWSKIDHISRKDISSHVPWLES